MIYRLILPEWASKENPKLPKVLEGEFSDEQIHDHNATGYNIYYLPNYPSNYVSSAPIVGSQIDRFEYVFVDMDLKDGVYKSKEEFLKLDKIAYPTKSIDTGNGIHLYWRVSDLDAMSYLRLSRRFMRALKTDEAVGQIFQLMRRPSTANTKDPNDPKWCVVIDSTPHCTYTCEQLDKLLPPISPEDEAHCIRHYNKTMGIDQPSEVDDTLPSKFLTLLKTNSEVADIWGNPQGDRSGKDYRLGHILLANGFSKAEATSVLVNVPKALSRGPTHRISYATSIVDKIWVHVPEVVVQADSDDLSESVEDIVSSGEDTGGTRFPCYKYIDDTTHGFRLGQVVGLVAGSGVGKTAIALNMIMGFVENNPEHDHFIVSLEQPAREIAARWKTMTGNNSQLYGKVHIISNYNKNGSFRNLSLAGIETYLKKFKEKTGKKIGSVTIDHIGALSSRGPQGEFLDLIGICKSMKSFAVGVDCILIMQSQTSREKAGIGDIDLNKDAAYGTVAYESFCDYLITLHQPLKRCYAEGAPTVMSFKFCKIRHKKQHLDNIKEDVCYRLFFDPANEMLREMSPDEDKSFTFFLSKCINKRKADQKTDLITYVSRSN